MGVGGALPSGKGVTREGSLANEGTSLRGMDNNFLFLWVCVCVLQVTLAYESIVLYMCEGKVLMDNDIFHYSHLSTKVCQVISRFDTFCQLPWQLVQVVLCRGLIVIYL